MFKRLLTCSLRIYYISQDNRLFRSYGYNLRGHRARCRRRYSPRGPRITAIPIVCTEGLLDVGLYTGHVNGETFLDFVNNILTPCLLPFDGFNPRSVVILCKITVFLFCFTYESYNLFCMSTTNFILRFLQIMQQSIILKKL